MEIFFIRHAQKSKKEIDPDLTESGIKQVEYLAKRFNKEKFHRIYCSNMKRAIQTAHILGERLSLRPKVENSLREFDVGVLKKNKKEWDNSLKNKYQELEDFLKKLTENPNLNERVLIIAHGNTNRLILALLLELDLNNLVRFGQVETAVNSVYWLDKFKNWRLRSWNDVSHLPKSLLGKEIY